MPARLTGKGVKTFKELTVWNKAVDFAVLIYETSHSFPKSEQYGIVSHIQKTVVSIPSNIAEGFGRNTRPDFVRFLRIALASLYERQTQLEIASKLMYYRFDFV